MDAQTLVRRIIEAGFFLGAVLVAVFVAPNSPLSRHRHLFWVIWIDSLRQVGSKYMGIIPHVRRTIRNNKPD